MSANGNDNDDDNSNNIIFTIKYTKLYLPVVTLSEKDNQKLSNHHKAKSENENMTNDYRYFHELNFVGLNRLFVFVYSNQDDNAQRYKARKYYLPKSVIKNHNVNTNGKNFCEQLILI